MNRRGFIAGLLASSAAVPLVGAFAHDMGVEPMIGLDLAEEGEVGGYTGFAIFQSTPSTESWMTERFLLNRSMRRVLDLVPIPGDDVLLYGGPAPSGDMRQPDDEPDTGGDPRPAGDL